MAAELERAPNDPQRIADRLESIAGDVSMGLARPPDVAEQDVSDLLAAATILRLLAEGQ